jgi:hypothetical protein
MKHVFGRGNYANVTATLALVVALGGTSYAAIKLPANSVGSAQLKKNAVTSKKIKKSAVSSSAVKNGSLLTSDFKSGQLPSGPQGSAGPRGLTGPAGPFIDTLPAGKSVRGSFLLSNDATAANQIAATSISYGFQLRVEPDVETIFPAGTPPAGCSGTPDAPNAAPGFVCVFLTATSPTSSFGIIATNLTPRRFGLGLLSNSTAAGRNEVSGSWVATGV